MVGEPVHGLPPLSSFISLCYGPRSTRIDWVAWPDAGELASGRDRARGRNREEAGRGMVGWSQFRMSDFQGGTHHDRVPLSLLFRAKRRQACFPLVSALPPPPSPPCTPSPPLSFWRSRPARARWPSGIGYLPSP